MKANSQHITTVADEKTRNLASKKQVKCTTTHQPSKLHHCWIMRKLENKEANLNNVGSWGRRVISKQKAASKQEKGYHTNWKRARYEQSKNQAGYLQELQHKRKSRRKQNTRKQANRKAKSRLASCKNTSSRRPTTHQRKIHMSKRAESKNGNCKVALNWVIKKASKQKEECELVTNRWFKQANWKYLYQGS